MSDKYIGLDRYQNDYGQAGGECWPTMNKDTQGDYALFEDAYKAIQELQARVEQLSKEFSEYKWASNIDTRSIKADAVREAKGVIVPKLFMEFMLDNEDKEYFEGAFDHYANQLEQEAE